MEIFEINNYIATGRYKEICISRDLLFDYNMVRSVVIKSETTVSVEIHDYGFDDGGLIIEFTYSNQASLILNIEIFLKKSIADWVNFNTCDSYPNCNPESNGSFIDDLKEKKINFPRGWKSYKVSKNYWFDKVPSLEP